MKEIKTQIIINAMPDRVWSFLTDFNRYPEWNPFIQSLTGEVKEGGHIQARIVPPGSRGMIFKPTILKFTKNRELRWIGYVLFKGLYDGEHRFELQDNGSSKVGADAILLHHFPQPIRSKL